MQKKMLTLGKLHLQVSCSDRSKRTEALWMSYFARLLNKQVSKKQTPSLQRSTLNLKVHMKPSISSATRHRNRCPREKVHFGDRYCNNNFTASVRLRRSLNLLLARKLGWSSAADVPREIEIKNQNQNFNIPKRRGQNSPRQRESVGELNNLLKIPA